jgi:hypothetical protein
LEKNIFIFIPVNANPRSSSSRYPPVFGLHFLITGQEQALASYWLEKVANSTPLFLKLTNPLLLAISKKPVLSQGHFITVINGCKNMRTQISHRRIY